MLQFQAYKRQTNRALPPLRRPGFRLGVVENRDRARFKPDARSTLDKLIGTGGYVLRARACKECGNVQTFIREN